MKEPGKCENSLHCGATRVKLPAMNEKIDNPIQNSPNRREAAGKLSPEGHKANRDHVVN